jgi:hypothetical protein
VRAVQAPFANDLGNLASAHLELPLLSDFVYKAYMNRLEALEKISKALALLTHQIGAENLAGFLSKNRLIEDLLLPVFQIALNVPRLRNLNQENINFPYIDLADYHARLAIQVTTDKSAAKITETLRQFISHKYQKRLKRLIVFILTPSKPNFSLGSKQKWKKICTRKLSFNPRSDVITTQELFSLIAHLTHSKLLSIHEIVAKSVVGEAYIDVERLLGDLSIRQIEHEQKTEKYIPDIFIETRETKNLVRAFAHPALFFQRTLDSPDRLGIPGWNRFLDKTGLPPLPFPTLTAHVVARRTLANTGKSAADLSLKLEDTTNILKKYHDFSRSKPLPFGPRKDRRHVFEENTFTLQTALGWGLNHQLEDLTNELRVVRASVFILTGRAGQGKTNLVCDFVKNFLLKHKVPCAYVSVRRLRSTQAAELGDTIQRLLFQGKTASFADAASLLSTHACNVGRPFVLIIDGLNEHHRISEFAEQLEFFIEDLVRYPHLKVFLTCRSEYFRERFGNLIRAPLREHVFLLEANENRLEAEAHDEMVDGYFKFFQIREDMVSSRVVDVLKKDMLLLRFFCEAYGAKDKPAGGHPEFISNIYREQIFEIYLDRKLGMAKAFLQRLIDKPSPTDEKTQLAAVIEHCLSHMLRNWQFADVPMSVVPNNLHDALYALLDEELVLRRDIPHGTSTFSPSSETINFTFDEFRDFLLAQYLLQRVFASDRKAFEEHISHTDPRSSQVIEGLKRFLFYASRKEENGEFWTFYRDQAWYKDVYDSEVFSIDTNLLRVEDHDFVVKALETGDERAIAFAVRLAMNWDPIYRRLLNLDLLISFVTRSDNIRFDALIVRAFTTIEHYNEGSSAKGFCRFVSEHIIPKFASVPKEGRDGLFRFLILLLPVDSRYDLNSESYFVFLAVLEKFPEYGINLLVESLHWTPTRHRPYVWRLLSSESAPLSLVEPLRKRAEDECSMTRDTDEVRCREARRFLRRLGTRVEASAQ